MSGSFPAAEGYFRAQRVISGHGGSFPSFPGGVGSHSGFGLFLFSGKSYLSHFKIILFLMLPAMIGISSSINILCRQDSIFYEMVRMTAKWPEMTPQ
jgi:hypothetical protein